MKKGSLILKIVVGIIFVLAFFGIYMIATGGEKTSPEMASAATFVVNLSLGLLILAAVLVVISSAVTMLKHPKGLKKTLLGLAIFLVLFAISYAVASDIAVFGSNGEELITPERMSKVSKWSGAGLNFSYILLAVGGLFFVSDLVKSLIKS